MARVQAQYRRYFYGEGEEVSVEGAQGGSVEESGLEWFAGSAGLASLGLKMNAQGLMRFEGVLLLS